jgi:hypothetical protein
MGLTASTPFFVQTAHVGGIITYSLTMIELMPFRNDSMIQGTGLVAQGKPNPEDGAINLLVSGCPGWLTLPS